MLAINVSIPPLATHSLQPQHHDRSAQRGTPLNLGTNDPPPVDLSVGDIRSQISAEWLQIAQRSQWRAYRKLKHRSF